MKFLTEVLENTITVIEEGANPARRFIEGVFMQAGIPNKNNRIYPVATLQKEVNRCISENISKNRFYGELGHPAGPNINGDRIAIHIKELSQDGNNFKGKAMIASTPMGSIVNGLLQDGASLGVSSRALGSLKAIKTESPEGKELQEVQDDLKLLAIDVVMDPSAPDAYVNAVNENKEWVYNTVAGMWMEQVVERHKKTIKTTKKLSEQQKLGLFESFLRNIKL
jgi:hypothetical protein